MLSAVSYQPSVGKILGGPDCSSIGVAKPLEVNEKLSLTHDLLSLRDPG
jgi:hypothetical protein